MVKTIEIRDRVVYLDGNNFVLEVMGGCAIQKSNLVREPPTNWLTFNPEYMNEQMNQKGKIIIEYIFDLRKQKRDEEAIALSDAFFQSFTPLMNILAEQRNFYELSHMRTWLISSCVRGRSESAGINRHRAGGESPPHKRRSCSIMAPSHARAVVRSHVKR